MKHVELKDPNPCPYCGAPNNYATATVEEDAVPKEGDLTICYGCLNVTLFNKDHTTRKPTDDEYFEIYTDPQVQESIRLLKELQNRLDEEERDDARL